jgi:hypothetical protein
VFSPFLTLLVGGERGLLRPIADACFTSADMAGMPAHHYLKAEASSPAMPTRAPCGFHADLADTASE